MGVWTSASPLIELILFVFWCHLKIVRPVRVHMPHLQVAPWLTRRRWFAWTDLEHYWVRGECRSRLVQVSCSLHLTVCYLQARRWLWTWTISPAVAQCMMAPFTTRLISTLKLSLLALPQVLCLSALKLQKVRTFVTNFAFNSNNDDSYEIIIIIIIIIMK